MNVFLQKYAAAIVAGALILAASVFAHLYLVEKTINDEMMLSRRTHQFLLQVNGNLHPNFRQAFRNLGYPLPDPQSNGAVQARADTTASTGSATGIKK